MRGGGEVREPSPRRVCLVTGGFQFRSSSTTLCESLTMAPKISKGKEKAVDLPEYAREWLLVKVRPSD